MRLACMRFFKCFAIVTVLIFSSMSWAANFCQISVPNKRDRNLYYCSKSYGITYRGYLTSRLCYESRDDAVAAMESSLACQSSDVKGGCYIMFPFERDFYKHYCPANTYGVAYSDAFIENVCYDSMDDAVAAMNEAQICQ